MKLLKKNIFFIILFVMAVLALLMRNRTLITTVVSHPDSQIAFSTGDSVLEQTWQPHVKKIAGVSVPYASLSDFESNVELLIYSDDYSELLLQTSIWKEFQKDEEGTLEYFFKTIKVTPGERYRIQLRYTQTSSEGTLAIASGSNYSGCSIDGSSCGEAAAFHITFQKSSSLFWAFMVFFPFLSFSLFFMIMYDRKWEECIGLSMITTAAVLYVTGLFEKLMAGMALVYILAVISFLFSIYLYNKKEMQIKNLLSPAFFIYVVLFVLILLNCHDARFAKVDEYSQWGMAVKDMFYYQSFAKHINTTVLIPRYPPFSAIIEYFFVYANGLFAPKLVYVAFQTMLMSASMIICAAAGNKWRYLIPSVAVMIAMPAIFFVDAYNCVIVDPLLAVFVAYVLICYFLEKPTGFNLFRILGGLFALALTKDMGMVIAGLLTVVMIADRLYSFIRQKKFVIKELLLPCLCALFVIAVFISWQIYMSIPVKEVVSEPQVSELQMSEPQVSKPQVPEPQVSEGVQAAENISVSEVAFDGTVSASGITLEKILGLLRHEDGGYRYQTIKNFLLEIFDGETYTFGNISVSYVDIYIFMMILIGLLAYFRFWGEHSERMIAFGLFTFLAGLCYSMVLLLAFLFAFEQRLALALVGNARYLASFVGGVVSALAALILHRAAKREDKHKSHSLITVFCLTACIAICTPISSFIIRNRDLKILDDDVYGYDIIAEIFRSFSAKGEKVFYICNGSNGDSYWVFNNTVSPLTEPYAQYNIYASEEAYEKQTDIWTLNGEEIQDIGHIVPCEAWEEELRNCRYVFIFHPNEVFRESYESLFEEPDTIDDGTFYQVKCTDEKVVLAYIGKTGVKSYK